MIEIGLHLAKEVISAWIRAQEEELKDQGYRHRCRAQDPESFANYVERRKP